MEQKISVVINTYNAQKHLAEVLETVKGFDEIVVCDMESTDRTIEIASNYGCKIVYFPKGNHSIVEPARTFAIQSATYNWVFVVDADELVLPGLRPYLYKVIKSSNAPAGLYVPRVNRFLKRKQHTSSDYQLRFMKKEGTYWPEYIHSHPHIDGNIEKIPLAKDRYLDHLTDETIYDVVRTYNNYTNYEVEKKKDRNYGLGALIYRPIWGFIRFYFIQGGWRDGLIGFIRCVLRGYYQFLVVAKIVEKRYDNLKS